MKLKKLKNFLVFLTLLYNIKQKVHIKQTYTIRVNEMKCKKYRSRSEIIGAILEAANGGGATKTTIMYKAVLSHESMKEYLLSLVENNLIEYEQGRMTYRTTPKGMRLLQLYNNMNEMVQPSFMKIEKRNNDYYPFL
jgi:predicted transcriptional regulator